MHPLETGSHVLETDCMHNKSSCPIALYVCDAWQLQSSMLANRLVLLVCKSWLGVGMCHAM